MRAIVIALVLGLAVVACAIEARFRMDLITRSGSTTPDFADVELVLENGVMRALASGVRVPTERRFSLDVPEG